MNIFNYFSDLKKEFELNENVFSLYKIVNLSGKLVYIEGHKGLLNIGEAEISCKVNNGVFVIKGEKLRIKVLSTTTLCVEGKIYKTEVF